MRLVNIITVIILRMVLSNEHHTSAFRMHRWIHDDCHYDDGDYDDNDDDHIVDGIK